MKKMISSLALSLTVASSAFATGTDVRNGAGLEMPKWKTYVTCDTEDQGPDHGRSFSILASSKGNYILRVTETRMWGVRNTDLKAKKVVTKRAGAPMEFRASGASLFLNGTVAPSSDGTLPGLFVTKKRTEVEVLCKLK